MYKFFFMCCAAPIAIVYLICEGLVAIVERIAGSWISGDNKQ